MTKIHYQQTHFRSRMRRSLPLEQGLRPHNHNTREISNIHVIPDYSKKPKSAAKNGALLLAHAQKSSPSTRTSPSHPKHLRGLENPYHKTKNLKGAGKLKMDDFLLP